MQVIKRSNEPFVFSVPESPTYLVLASDGRLYPYWQEFVLRGDIRFRTNPALVQVFKLNNTELVPRWEPFDVSDLVEG